MAVSNSNPSTSHSSGGQPSTRSSATSARHSGRSRTDADRALRWAFTKGPCGFELRAHRV